VLNQNAKHVWVRHYAKTCASERPKARSAKNQGYLLRKAQKNKLLLKNTSKKLPKSCTFIYKVDYLRKGYHFMSILPDHWIREQSLKHKMIEPFVDNQVRTVNINDEDRAVINGEMPLRRPQLAPKPEGVISYGVSSYGYDARVADEFKIFTNVDSGVVDPKAFSPNSFVDRKTDVCIIPPNSFALARTVEYFRIPRDVLVICLGKSTYARCGIIVNVTPLEPEWEGHVTLEFSNTTPLPAKIYANEGACQFLFLKADQVCDISYRDRLGKYMGQVGVTLPRL
jgi:dCTP deaminase